MGKHFNFKGLKLVIIVMFLMLALVGCTANTTSTTEPANGTTVETASPVSQVLHQPSSSTVATSIEPLGAFTLDEIGTTSIVDIPFLESKMSDPNWIIIDGREKKDYDQGHIPGAIHLGDAIWKVLKHPMDGRVIPAERMAKILGEAGISNDKHVIVYGTKGDYHVTCEMGPAYIGLEEWDYLSGGYEAWVKAGKKVETAPVKRPAATFTPNIKNQNMYVSTPQLAAIVAAKDSNYYLLDTRSKDEFSGLGLQGIRAGRIPGANNFPPEVNLDKESKAILSTEKLAEIYKDVPKDKTVILYCHRGCRTGFSFLALRSLGYKDVRVYEDGFIVWNSWLELPVDEEHFINFRGDLKTTVEKVKELDKK